jgi:hypothetical protein
VLRKKICAKYRFVDGGLYEWHIIEAAAAERDRLVYFSPGLDGCSVGAGERRALLCGWNGAGTGIWKDADRRPRIHKEPCTRKRISEVGQPAEGVHSSAAA